MEIALNVRGKGEEMRGYYAVGLISPKTPANVGSALRACDVYGAAFLAQTGNRYGDHGTDTFKSYKHMPFFRVDDLKEIIPKDCVPVAVELLPNARSLVSYTHPERAFYIFGPEDGTLGEKTISWVRDVVYIPTKRCMNLAATVNVVLYDRLAKSKDSS